MKEGGKGGWEMEEEMRGKSEVGEGIKMEENMKGGKK